MRINAKYEDNILLYLLIIMLLQEYLEIACIGIIL